MKSLLRSFLIYAAALWLINQLVAGVAFAKGYETLLFAAVALGAFNLFLKPILNILLLPINIMTLGALRWVVNVITLYLLTLVVPGFQVTGFYFPGIAYQSVAIPAITLGTIGAYVAVSFLLSFISGLFFWLVK